MRVFGAIENAYSSNLTISFALSQSNLFHSFLDSLTNVHSSSFHPIHQGLKKKIPMELLAFDEGSLKAVEESIGVPTTPSFTVR